MNQEKVRDKKIFAYLFSSILFFSSCKDKVDNSTIDSNKINKSEMIDKILMAQLEGGCSQDYPFEYSKNDLNVTIPLIKNKLISSGFRFIDKNEFNKRIYSIFKRTIDTNSDSEYLYVNFLEKCNRGMNFQINNLIDYQGSFIIKNEYFITDFFAIPQIIDYQKEYPQISKIEDNPIIVKNEIEQAQIEVKQWKEISDLSQQRVKNLEKIIARNKYLFNDDKPSFVWLRFNDEYFLRSLVKIFGYIEDKELLKWVIEKEKYDGKDSEEFSKMLWHKTCDGKLTFHKETLEIISQNGDESKLYYKLLNDDYIKYLVDDKNKIDLTFAEKAEIIANIQSFIYSNEANYNIFEYMGNFAEWNDNSINSEAYSKEFKKHNYYNLPNFEKQWKQAKLDGNGIALPGEE